MGLVVDIYVSRVIYKNLPWSRPGEEKVYEIRESELKF